MWSRPNSTSISPPGPRAPERKEARRSCGPLFDTTVGPPLSGVAAATLAVKLFPNRLRDFVGEGRGCIAGQGRQRHKRRYDRFHGDSPGILSASLAELAGGGPIVLLCPLVMVAVDLFIEGFGIEGAGRAGHAGDDRKRDQRRQDGFHDLSPFLGT